MAKITAVLYFDAQFNLEIYKKSSRLAYTKIYSSTFSDQCNPEDIENICKYYKCRKYLFYTIHQISKTKYLKPKLINSTKIEKFKKIAKENLTPTNTNLSINDGIYLNDLLRSFNNKFPKNFNINIRYLRDTYSFDENFENLVSQESMKLVDLLLPYSKIDKTVLNYSIKLSFLNLSYKMLKANMIYQLDDDSIETIASLASHKYIGQDEYLAFVVSLMQVLYTNKTKQKYSIKLTDNIVEVSGVSQMSKELKANIQVPSSLKLSFI